MKSFGLIYKVTNKVNSKIYIGQTVQQFNKRRVGHINNARWNKNNNHFHNALMKYNEEVFIWEIIEYCDSKEELNEMEFHYIMQHDSFKNGYNMTLGGEGSVGYLHSNTTKAKMSEASLHSANHVNRGKKLSSSWRANISKANKGRALPEAARKKMIKTKKANAVVGKNHPDSKMFVITTPKDIIFCIHGLANFSRGYKDGLLDFRLLSAVANGKRNHHKGYKCRHYDELLDFDIPKI